MYLTANPCLKESFSRPKSLMINCKALEMIAVHTNVSRGGKKEAKRETCFVSVQERRNSVEECHAEKKQER